jgi:hypothetical protein
MAHRSKQNKPCPNRECERPTLNRQDKIHHSQLEEIAEVAPDIIPAIIDANICSSCGCVYIPTRHKQKNIIGFHDDPNMDADTAEAVWHTLDD